MAKKLSLKVRRSNAGHISSAKRLIRKEKPKAKDYIRILYHDKAVSVQTKAGKRLNAKGKQYVYKQAEASYKLVNRLK